MATLTKPSLIPDKTLYRIGSATALVQLAVILLYGVVTAIWGVRPNDAEEALKLFINAPVQGFLRGDLPLLILVGLYIGLFPALYLALKQQAPLAVTVAFGATLIAVIIGFTNESSFALWHLAGRYQAVTGEAERQAIVAAGEAVIAAGWWNSTEAYISGLFLQGSGVLISIVMLRSRSFGKLTAVSGLVGNGFDLLQHLLTPFVVGVNTALAPFMGLAYLLWYPLLARDLRRLSRLED